MTTTTADLEAVVGPLSADQLAHLGAAFTARAAERRRMLTEDECRTAIKSAPLTPAWQRSQLSDIGRVRIACCLLVAEHRLHPERFAELMTSVAEEIISLGHEVAVEAVGAGIADGMIEKEGTDDA